MRRAALSTRLRRIEEEVGWIEWQVEQVEHGLRPMSKSEMETVKALMEHYTLEEMAAILLECGLGKNKCPIEPGRTWREYFVELYGEEWVRQQEAQKETDAGT